ncbi:MAG: Uma2 family endonuclease [Caldilineales bacterium]|nr:Uma2 family endonuclease [Caldilineales bacterium]
MATQPASWLTPQEYLTRERRAMTKSEYLNGEVFAMAGASKEHNLITVNIAASLHGQLRRRPCTVYANDMRVKVRPSGLYTYPDVVVVCGQAEFEDEQVDTLLNPTLLIEVLSDSTEAYDRGRKFDHYRALASLQEYLLVTSQAAAVDQFVRQPDGRWLLTAYRGSGAVVNSAAIDCRLPLAEIYDKVDLPDADDRATILTVLKEPEPAYMLPRPG